MKKAAPVVESGVRWTLDMSVINSKERTKCPVSGCGKTKDPRQPCCQDCFKNFGLELVNAIKEACGVPAYVKTPPTHNSEGGKKTSQSKSKPADPAPATSQMPAERTAPVVETAGRLRQVRELATKRLQESCLEIYGQNTAMNQEYLQFIVRVAYSDCPFQEVLELIPQAALAAQDLYWEEVAREVTRQETLAEEKRLAAVEEAKRLERLERCKRLAQQALPKLPVEVVDPHGLANQLLKQDGNWDLPPQALVADIKARLAKVQREGDNPDLLRARCRWAAKNHLQNYPKDAGLKSAGAAKKIAALRPKSDPLPTEALEKAFVAEVSLVRIQAARGIESFLGLNQPSRKEVRSSV